MTPLFTAVRWRTAALVPLFFGTPVLAQRRQPPEFTQQGVLVANFWVVGKETPSLSKNDMRFGRRVGDAVRNRLAHLVNKREAKVIDAATSGSRWCSRRSIPTPRSASLTFDSKASSSARTRSSSGE